jgi:hypothetical protein
LCLILALTIFKVLYFREKYIICNENVMEKQRKCNGKVMKA